MFSIPVVCAKLMAMIRQFRPEDAPSCNRLIQACIENDGSLSPTLRGKLLQVESPEVMQQRAGLFYVAVYESAEGVIGLGGLDLNELRLLHVAPEQQRRGIGTALLAHLEGMVPPVLFADIFVYASPSAENFYRSNGYRTGGECSIAWGSESIRTIFMTKPVSSSSRGASES